MSTLTNEVGLSVMQYDLVTTTGNIPLFRTTLLLDASGEKAAFVGFVWHPTIKTGTINIRKVHYRAGAVASFGALSVFRVSLQDVSATAGPPYQPDGTADQTYSLAAGTGPTANAWNTTGNLSADRVVDLSVYGVGVANSRYLAVVFEETTFTAADSVIISSLDVADGKQTVGGLISSQSVLQTGGTWAQVVATQPIVAFELDDGTFAFLLSATPISALGTATTANNATFRAIGVKFKVPTQRKLDRAALFMVIPTSCDGDLIIYDLDGTTALITVPIDNDAVRTAAATQYAEVAFQPVTLEADTYYRWVFVPSTINAATIYHLDVNAAGLMDGFFLGQNAHYTTRDSAGVWTDTLTRRPHFGLGFSAFHDGASAGGGLRLAGHGGLAA
mgnify:CR=1 FL=1